MAASSRLWSVSPGNAWRYDTIDDDDEREGNWFFFPPPVLDDAMMQKSPISWLADDAGSRAKPPPPKAKELPAEWLQKFQPASVTYLPGEGLRGRARLAAWPHVEVAFASWPAGDPATPRLCRMAEMLSGTSFVPRFLASGVVGGRALVLTESPGARTLARLIGEAAGGALAVPLRKSLPLLADLLRGLAAVEDLGMVSCDLSEENIYTSEGDTCAVVADLSSTYPLGDLPHLSSADALRGSAFRQAPEMRYGLPTRAANGVWQLGLVFARMLFGGDVPTAAEAKEWSVVEFDDATPEGRALIRQFVREHFDIRDAPGFRRLSEGYADVLRVLTGMLEKDPDRRLAARAALQKVTDVARLRGIALHPPRSRAA